MTDEQVLHAMCIDDSYHVERVLAEKPNGTTELVTIGGAGPFVRKKIPLELANRRVWSILPECACARLPHVETTYELPDCFVVVYDYMPGEVLESFVQAKGRLGETQALDLAAQICEAAGALHAAGVIHRDITPTNVIVAADGAHLIDLGIARTRNAQATRDTTSLGTWGYASPEQYGFAQTDARSDVYSIGRLLGFMLCGVHPGESTYDETLARTDGIASSTRAAIEKACAFEPSARYQSAADLARALDRAFETRRHPDAWDEGVRDASDQASAGQDEASNTASVQLPAEQEPKDRPSQPDKPARKKHGCLAFLAVALVAFIVVATIGITGMKRAERAEYESATFAWPTTGLATLLPEPASTWGTMPFNDDSYLSFEVRGCDEEAYLAYVEACQAKGFDVEPEWIGDYSYYAYDAEGNRLSLHLFTSSSEMSVSIDGALELDELTWPTFGLAASLPAPVSHTGKVTTDSSSAWQATIGQTALEDYAAYVDELLAAGFDQDYKRGDESFSGTNADGIQVTVRYAGANRMTVRVESPDIQTQQARKVQG